MVVCYQLRRPYQFHVGPIDCLSYKWFGAMLISHHLISKSSACKSCGCFIDSVSNWHIGFCLEVCLIHLQPSQVSDVYQSWSHVVVQHDKSHGNLSSGHHLGERKACVEFKQESHAQLSLAIELCSLVPCFDLWIASLLILNLMTTFACYPSLYGPCSYNLIGATWNFTFVVRLVMVLWVATNGAATKPGAYCGCTHKVVLLGMR
jgi:hypothetical protein